MLKIWYRDGNLQVAENSDLYFKYLKEDSWFEDSLVQEMIKDVDKSIVVGSHLIESPVLGPIPPETLSGGVKTLILMLMDNEHIYSLSHCGDNCAKWAIKIGEKKDITAYLGYMMDFTGDFEIQIMNTGKIVHNQKEYLDELFKIEVEKDLRIPNVNYI